MAGENNNLDQKIVLDVEGYVKPLQEANQAQQEFVDDSNKRLTDSSKTFAQHMKQVKEWSNSIKGDLNEFKNAFMDNLATGAKALTLGLGADAIKSAAESSMEMALDAGKKFAELKSRVGGTEAQFKSWDSTVKQAAINTKTNLAQLQDAFLDLSDSANPDQITKFMDQVGQATMLNHGNGHGVSSFLKSSLQGQGREFNSGNVTDVLGGADLLRRKGTGFGSMEQAMSALGGMNQHSIGVNKLNEHQVASMLAGASKATGDSGRSTAAIKELLDLGAKGQLQHLGSMLGGSFKDKNGRFSLNTLGSASAQKSTHLGKDDATSLEIFKQTSGLSADAAEATFKMIRNFEKMNEATAEAAADQKSLGQSATEAGDNLKDTIQQVSTKMVVGFEDILGGFQKPLNSLLGGHYAQAAGELGGAVSSAGAGVAKHPMLAAGSLLATAAGGALITSLASKVLGGGGGALGGIIEKVTGKGVQHVWVDNPDQIRTGAGASSLFGGPGGAAGAAAAGGMGFMQKAGMVGAAGVGGLALGGAINEIADQHADTNAYGQKANIFEKGIAKLLPEALGGMTKDQYNDTYNNPQKVVVEIHSTDGRFDVKPKKEDNQRSGRNH